MSIDIHCIVLHCIVANTFQNKTLEKLMCENPKMSGQIKFRIHLIKVPKVSRFDIRIPENFFRKENFFFQFFFGKQSVLPKFPKMLFNSWKFQRILIFSRILKFSKYEILSGSDAIRVDPSKADPTRANPTRPEYSNIFGFLYISQK